VATLATFALVQLRAAIDQADATDPPPIARGQPVPEITGLTLDGATFSLAALRGKPVIVNFWGPSCVPCRDEFPLFKALLAAHQAEGLTIVGVLMDDPPAPARDFMREYGATWATVDDPDRAIRTAYRVAARPQSYFIDRDGILRSIQVGEMTQAEFDRQYAAIVGSAGGPPAPLATIVATGPTSALATQ
jgi:cytochrome c biogenesis protein CcmG, thiol:disulfide interchange protein DsbE